MKTTTYSCDFCGHSTHDTNKMRRIVLLIHRDAHEVSYVPAVKQVNGHVCPKCYKDKNFDILGSPVPELKAPTLEDFMHEWLEQGLQDRGLL